MADNVQEQTTPAGATSAGDGSGGAAAPPQTGNGKHESPRQAGPPEAPGGTNGRGDSGNGGARARGGLLRNPIFLIAVVVVLIIVAIWGVNFYHYNQNHASTDDAYVTGDLINASPIISGTLAQINVQEGDTVKAGQLIARLDDSGPLASFRQAEAAYDASMSQVPQAKTSLVYERSTVAAQIQQAQAALNAQGAKTNQARYQVQLTQATLHGQIAQAEAQLAAAKAQARTAHAQIVNAQQAVHTAQAAAAAARQQVASAQASATRAQRDEARYAALYGPNGSVAAVTAQQYDEAVAAAQQATAQLQATRDQATQATSQVDQARAQLVAANESYKAAQEQVSAYSAQVAIARSNGLQIPVQQSNVVNNLQTASQAQAQLAAAVAGQHQVNLRQQQVSTAIANARQARAAMQSARVTLQDTYIYAPSNGTIVRKAANVGDALSPGQTIVTMTKGSDVWLEANFKETQLQGMKPGQKVEISIDAFPHIVFLGKVASINEASGNVTALLPAENATGNFTKVVQRIPVKILFVPQQPGNANHYATAEDIANLRQGMSGEPTIDLTSK
ncbi:MAG TPA: HlyD family secretion protein [Capsulimonadaceae bacterium]|nr:HlyD family secretion protein [Capsulimonadaceae bacterium]